MNWEGHLNPACAKWSTALSAAPKYIMRPSDSSSSWSNILLVCCGGGRGGGAVKLCTCLLLLLEGEDEHMERGGISACQPGGREGAAGQADTGRQFSFHFFFSYLKMDERGW